MKKRNITSHIRHDIMREELLHLINKKLHLKGRILNNLQILTILFRDSIFHIFMTGSNIRIRTCNKNMKNCREYTIGIENPEYLSEINSIING